MDSNIPREDQQDAQRWAEEDDGITSEMRAMTRRTALFRAFVARHRDPQDATADEDAAQSEPPVT